MRAALIGRNSVKDRKERRAEALLGELKDAADQAAVTVLLNAKPSNWCCRSASRLVEDGRIDRTHVSQNRRKIKISLLVFNKK